MDCLLVAGLGNPGREYENTRHNIGFWLVDLFAARHGVSWTMRNEQHALVATAARGGKRILAVKPQTYVNESGRSLAAITRFYKLEPEAVLVIHDELNIDLGEIKVSVGGGPGGHNGLKSIISHIGNGFTRFRVGIGPKSPPMMEMKDFVLGRFSEEQLALLNGRMPEIVKGLELLVDTGPNNAMNQLNQRKTKQNERKEQTIQG